ncbi:MAG: N(4)-(beta-N-acetylglucosaminyl)-L-asparaginase [Planctomycetota bacterium]
MNRRKFLGASAGAAALGTAIASSSLANPVVRVQRPIFVATWPFGIRSTDEAVNVVADGGSMLDAIEKGIWVTESDVKNASVGIGGIPNADGQVELDACIMAGPNHAAGAVAALRDFEHPISVARDVMENTPHVMLVGDNAAKYAVKRGHRRTNLLTDQQKSKWLKWKEDEAKAKAQKKPTPRPKVNEQQHDTIAMLGLDDQGNLFGGCSTSGWGYKVPGRVGDSPIIGSGLYVDNQVGAAGATGLGENVMRFCGSFLVVEMMRQGADPTTACQKAIERIEMLDPLGLDELSVNFVALSKSGQYGAAGTNQGFKYAVSSPGSSEVCLSKSLTKKAIGPEGGNIK